DKGLWEKPARYKVKYLGGYGPGLISGERIRRAGGFHPGYRVAYDTLLLNLIRLTGPVSVTDEVMGAKFFRANSLTTSRRTGIRSLYRRRVHADRLALWQKAWDHYHKHGEVASVIRADIPRRLWREVQVQVDRRWGLLWSRRSSRFMSKAANRTTYGTMYSSTTRNWLDVPSLSRLGFRHIVCFR